VSIGILLLFVGLVAEIAWEKAGLWQYEYPRSVERYASTREAVRPERSRSNDHLL